LPFSSCVSDEANRYYLSERFPVKKPSEVAVLFSKPKRDFIVIADFQSRGDTAQAMQKKAAKIGADAVIVTFLGGYYDMRSQWASEDSQADSYSRVVATAVKYK